MAIYIYKLQGKEMKVPGRALGRMAGKLLGRKSHTQLLMCQTDAGPGRLGCAAAASPSRSSQLLQLCHSLLMIQAFSVPSRAAGVFPAFSPSCLSFPIAKFLPRPWKQLVCVQLHITETPQAKQFPAAQFLADDKNALETPLSYCKTLTSPNFAVTQR